MLGTILKILMLVMDDDSIHIPLTTGKYIGLYPILVSLHWETHQEGEESLKWYDAFINS
jgi:hypothetical protein